MKILKLYFAGLVLLFCLASCNLRGGAAASNETSVLPSSTPTITKTPTLTLQATPTRRATLIVFLTSTRGPSVTPQPLVTPIPSNMVLTIQAEVTQKRYMSGLGPYQCKLVSTDPPELAPILPKENFTGIFRLYNNGSLPWDNFDVAYFYMSGTKFQTPKYREQYIPYYVDKKGQLSIHIPMKAPAYPGVYYTIWGLRIHHLGKFFCTFPMIITVGLGE